MNWLSKFFNRIKTKLFGKIVLETSEQESKDAEVVTEKQEPIVEILGKLEVEEERDPYFIQIGLDFGTSYTKCVCRDINTDKAWVHIPNRTYVQELPFLIPSSLVIKNNEIFRVKDGNVCYPQGGIYNLKHALSAVAKGNLEDLTLVPYKSAVRLKKTDQLPALVATCAVYLLAGILGEIRKEIRSRFKGFGSNPFDYMAVNLAIPVEDAEYSTIRKVFLKVLGESWELADELCSYPRIHLNELVSLRKEIRTTKTRSFGEACFVYPEVSANVQGFVRSRVSSPGIYLFNDTGGGTVDQSIFIFSRDGYTDSLAYLSGRVLALGSGKIEEKAAEKSGKKDAPSLEKERKRGNTSGIGRGEGENI